MSAKCPRCAKLLTTVTARDMNIKAEVGPNTFRGVAFTCPECESIISVSLDPLALGRETVAAVVDALKPKDPAA